MQSNKILVLGDAQDEGIVNLARLLALKGWGVTLVSHRKAPKDLPESIKFRRIHLPISYPLSYLAFFEFAFYVLRTKPSIIHAFHLSDYGVLAGLARRFLLCRRVLVSATGTDVTKDAFTLRGWSIKHIVCLVEAVTCPDETAKSAAIELGTPFNRLSLVENPETNVDEFESIYRKLLAQKEPK